MFVPRHVKDVWKLNDEDTYLIEMQRKHNKLLKRIEKHELIIKELVLYISQPDNIVQTGPLSQ